MMPYVNVKTAGKLTREQREQIAKEISETLEKVAHKPKSATYIVFDHVELENWAIGDQLLG
jgi:4-oxalocrotonate tautomerase